MARNNYQYEKRQRDLAKKKKKQEKKQKKLDRTSGEPLQDDNDGLTPDENRADDVTT